MDKIDCDSLGHQLRSKRLARGLQEYQLAGILGVATRLIKDWEANLSLPSQAVLSILEKELGLPGSPNTLKPTAE